MSSKRMAISALLSNDASTSSQPPSPALAPTSDEPPPKRQRHQGYNQQYYDSYNAYPYSPSTSSSPTSRYYPAPLPSQSPRSGSPSMATSHIWPQHPPPSRPQAEHRTHWDDGYRYASASSVPAPNAFDFARQHRQTSNLRGAEEDIEVGRDGRFQSPGIGRGQSIASVLSDRLRQPQTHTALPVPPQLRRDAHHSHHSYVAPTAIESFPLPPVRTRELSPPSVTPRATPPSLSPRSSYSLQHTIPTPSYSTHSVSPTTYAPQSVSPTIYSRQNVSQLPHPPSPNTHPTTPYPPPRSSIHLDYAPNISPITSQQHFSRVSPSASYRPPSGSPTASYTPPFKPPSRPPSSRPPSSRPPSSRDHVPSPVSERTRSPPVTPVSESLPAPPPQLIQLDEAPLPQPLQQPGKMELEDERSFEDELLSLVDGEDLKPKVSRSTAQFPTLEPVEPPGVQANKTQLGPTKPPAKPRPTKPRAPAKSKSKATGKQTSATNTPAPTSSMPPPSPPPMKQQPAVSRAKGKAPSTKKKTAGASAVRSRSLSVKPTEPTPTPAPDIEMVREDDRQYCVCRMPYDEDRVMIACDRCDEWYHPACVGMPEVEVDLVDQYICAPCAKQKAGLQTTYKQRCHRGLKHIALHDTLPACWKPARGAFSKYCSDECGMAHMRAKILQSGRDAASLWPAVKNARRREGVTVTSGPVKVEEPDGEDNDMERRKATLMEARKALKDADERELGELLRRLDEIMGAREACKAALERVVMRRRLLDLAVDRATGRCCGWDVRLEMNDEEWTGWAMTETGRRALDGGDAQDDQQWWCQGPEKCPRHNGWQNIRDLDVQVEVDSKNSSIKQLTDRERELRRRIEDINPPSAPPRQHGKPGGRKKNPGKRSARG